jgi:pimeloyl-ACP methyl ester carboxylesterase
MGSSFPFQLQEPADAGKPWVVLIHGLGMSQRSWSDPFAEKLLGGVLSFDHVLTDLQASTGLALFSTAGRLAFSPPLRLSRPRPLSFWEFLKREGCGILSWSQEKPLGPIDRAVGELQQLLGAIPRQEKITLLGHSRGGLVARKYLQDRRPGWNRISGVVLLGVPNHGSGIAKLGRFLARPLSLLGGGKIHPSLPLQIDKNGSKTFRIRNFAANGFEGGVGELVPRSAFLRSLIAGEGEESSNNVSYLNVIGTRTDFIRFYLRLSPAGRVKPVFSLFDGLERILPPSLLPPEIRQGRGDGQVSLRSAWLPWAGKNIRVPANHAQLLVNPEVQGEVGKFLKTV